MCCFAPHDTRHTSCRMFICQIMSKYLIKIVYFLMFVMFGCAAGDKTSTPSISPEIRQLERRMDDLSGKITLIVNDTNRLHNKMEEVITSNNALHQKVEGLEAVVGNLNEQFLNHPASASTRHTGLSTAVKEESEPLLPPAEIRTSSEIPEYDDQKTTYDGSQSQVRRELFIKDNIVRLAETEFPDNKGMQWNILSFFHTTHLTCVKVEPEHAVAGSPRFEFIVSFENAESPHVIRILSFKDGKYRLFRAKDN